MKWLRTIVEAVCNPSLSERVTRLERELDALQAILIEQQQYAEEETLLRVSHRRDQKQLLYRLRSNLSKLKMRHALEGWSLGLSNQMDEIQDQIERLETEMRLDYALNQNGSYAEYPGY